MWFSGSAPEARRARFPTPIVGAAEAAYLAGLGRGFGRDDDSGMIRLYTEGMGSVGQVKPVAGLATTAEEKHKLVADLLRGVHLCAAAECLAFAKHVGLDLDQVLDLCLNAAGGSYMLEAYGPVMVKALRDGTAVKGWAAEQGAEGLEAMYGDLKAVVEEAGRLKVPLFLANQSLSLMTLALNSVRDAATASIVKVWTS